MFVTTSKNWCVIVMWRQSNASVKQQSSSHEERMLTQFGYTIIATLIA